MAFMGTAPLGSLIAGTLASKFGASLTILSGGIICLISAIIFVIYLPILRSYIRPHYIKLEILPEVSKGLQAATNLNMPPNK
jgi:MFS-type transporter involved in bile tolerance (Atg22 family)